MRCVKSSQQRASRDCRPVYARDAVITAIGTGQDSLAPPRGTPCLPTQCPDLRSLFWRAAQTATPLRRPVLPLTLGSGPGRAGSSLRRVAALSFMVLSASAPKISSVTMVGRGEGTVPSGLLLRAPAHRLTSLVGRPATGDGPRGARFETNFPAFALAPPPSPQRPSRRG